MGEHDRRVDDRIVYEPQRSQIAVETVPDQKGLVGESAQQDGLHVANSSANTLQIFFSDAAESVSSRKRRDLAIKEENKEN